MRVYYPEVEISSSKRVRVDESQEGQSPDLDDPGGDCLFADEAEIREPSG